ncbi:MAG: AarF/ABC1/UbiB kinase family protein [Alphaproteobacteria bacterium]|nr:AarF/ABC1/UbiB kinase family protein [Alphaproteobacteria bacterium]
MAKQGLDDRDRLGGRVRRYAQVGRSVGGLAARLAGERFLGLTIDRDRHAGELRAALGGLKGPLMKVAQILATVPDALPREYVAELAQLQSNAPPMGWPFVRRRMAAELGENWEGRFRGFAREAAAAASLGQVHRAQGRDGRELACKLQYPDMASAVEADLRQLKLVFAIYGRIDRSIDTGEVFEEISARLREELDYVREARHMRLYRAMLAEEAGVHVPEVIDPLSTGRLLTMEWLTGRKLMEFVEAPQKARDAIARNMFRAWYVPFYDYGVIHGDPHLGNYSVREDLSINLLDYGCVRVFKAHFVQGVIDLYRAMLTDDRDLAVHAYRSWGFDKLTNEVIDALNLWAKFLYGPLLEDRARPIQLVKTPGIYGREVAEQVHVKLRQLGGVRPPREFVFMDRAALGLGGVFMHLRASVNWHRLFHGLIDGFDAAAMARRQAKALKAVGLAPP